MTGCFNAPAPQARCPLGLKYGANPDEARKLLSAAANLGLSVVGVSFHVGSACKNLSTYSEAIATAKRVFDVAEELGHTMKLLDIGGGLCDELLWGQHSDSWSELHQLGNKLVHTLLLLMLACLLTCICSIL